MSSSVNIGAPPVATMHSYLSSRLALLILLIPLCARAADQTDPAEGFFTPDKLHVLRLTLTRDAWDLMQPSRRPRPMALVADSIPAPTTRPAPFSGVPTAPLSDAPKPPAVSGDKLPPNNFGYEYVYVRAHLQLDDHSLTDVACRFKGNASYDNYARSPRRPYKIDFDRFVPGRKFRGLGAVNLSNNAFDNSQLREILSYEVYRRAGLPSPRATLAVLYLTVPGLYDDHFVGCYTIIEEIDDKPFLKSHFDSTDGLLLKPEGVRGLPYMGEDIQSYDQRYHLKTNNPAGRAARQFIDFVKLLNYADDATFRRDLPRLLDVDNLLRYLAATVLVADLDSPLVTNHNFYLHTHPTDGLTRILPWDMNLSFAGYGGGGGGANDQATLSITHPWAGPNKLFDRVLAIPQHDRAYRAHLRNFCQQFYNPPAMRALLDAFQPALAQANQAAAAAKQPAVSAETGGGLFGGTRYSLRAFIDRRIPSVLDQLDDKDVPTFVPRPTPPRATFSWGLRAGPEFGNLTHLAQQIRQTADTDGDFKISLPEALAATDALYARLSTPPPDPTTADAATPTPGSEPKATTRMSPDSAPNPKDLSNAALDQKVPRRRPHDPPPRRRRPHPRRPDEHLPRPRRRARPRLGHRPDPPRRHRQGRPTLPSRAPSPGRQNLLPRRPGPRRPPRRTRTRRSPRPPRHHQRREVVHPPTPTDHGTPETAPCRA
jgi:hypothetical protein